MCASLWQVCTQPCEVCTQLQSASSFQFLLAWLFWLLMHPRIIVQALCFVLLSKLVDWGVLFIVIVAHFVSSQIEL